MYCSYCGQIVDENTVFCSKCGRKIDEETSGEGTNSGTVVSNERTSPELVSQRKSLTNQEKINANPQCDAKTSPRKKNKSKVWIPILIVGTILVLFVFREKKLKKEEMALWGQPYQAEGYNDYIANNNKISDEDITEQFMADAFKVGSDSVEEEFYNAAEIADMHYKFLIDPNMRQDEIFSSFETKISGRITDEITPVKLVVCNLRDGSFNKMYVLYSVPYELFILDYPNNKARNGEIICEGITYIASQINDTKKTGEVFSFGEVYNTELFENIQEFDAMIERDTDSNIYEIEEYDAK